MDATEAKNSPEQASRTYHAPVRPPLPVWVPPVCAVMFGGGVALQAPSDAEPGLMAPFVGLALAFGAWALLGRIRARQGVQRRSPAPWTLALTVVVPAFHYYALNSASDLRSIYLVMGVSVAGIAWYRLQKRPRQ